MTKKITITIKLQGLLIGSLLVCGCLSNGPAALAFGTQAPSHRIAAIRHSNAFDGAGCSLRFLADWTTGKERNIFESNYDGDALMNIDGKDTRLRLVSSREAKRPPKMGEHSTYTYRARGISVRVDYVVTGICAPDDESCEVTHYSATIHVTRGASKRMVKAVGICGS